MELLKILVPIFKLELVEQLPNVITVVPAVIAQLALIEAGGIDPVVSVNLASWFGPHKVINFGFMFISNSLKKSWVDGSWSLHNLVRRIRAKL